MGALGRLSDLVKDSPPAAIRLSVGVLSPRTTEALQRLDHLGLLEDEMVLSLIGQAPIDPIGLYGALRDTGTWAFSAYDFTVIRVLAKKQDKPVAAVRIDLLSDDLTFVVLREGQLVEHSTTAAEHLSEMVGKPVLATWLDETIQQVIREGMAAAP